MFGAQNNSSNESERRKVHINIFDMKIFTGLRGSRSSLRFPPIVVVVLTTKPGVPRQENLIYPTQIDVHSQTIITLTRALRTRRARRAATRARRGHQRHAA